MATALPCSYYAAAGYDLSTWEAKCYNMLPQQVSCTSLSAADLAIGQYERALYSPDGQYTCYDRTITDVGDEVVEGLHGTIEDTYRTIADNWVFYAIAAVSVLAFAGALWLLTREILRA